MVIRAPSTPCTPSRCQLHTDLGCTCLWPCVAFSDSDCVTRRYSRRLNLVMSIRPTCGLVEQNGKFLEGYRRDKVRAKDGIGTRQCQCTPLKQLPTHSRHNGVQDLPSDCQFACRKTRPSSPATSSQMRVLRSRTPARVSARARSHPSNPPKRHAQPANGNTLIGGAAWIAIRITSLEA